MFIRMFLAVTGTMLLVGCTGGGTALPQLSSDDPANPTAAESPLPPRSQTLALNDGQPLPIPAAANPAELMPEMGTAGMQHGHDMAGMKHAPPATRPGENAAISAARWTPLTLPTTRPTTAAAAAAVTYTCKMHPEVISDHPGTCPKCSMKLVPKQPATTEQPAHAGHGGHP
jgi:hypothetical protein